MKEGLDWDWAENYNEYALTVLSIPLVVYIPKIKKKTGLSGTHSCSTTQH